MSAPVRRRQISRTCLILPRSPTPGVPPSGETANRTLSVGAPSVRVAEGTTIRLIARRQRALRPQSPPASNRDRTNDVGSRAERPLWVDRRVDAVCRVAAGVDCQVRRGPGARRNWNGSLGRPATTYQASPVESESRMFWKAATTSATSRIGKPMSMSVCSDPLMMLVWAKDGHRAWIRMPSGL